MLRKILMSALLSGGIASLAVSGVQYVKTLPLIQQAEVYENAQEETPAPAPAATAAPAAAHEHEHEHGTEWEPQEGAERLGFTLLANLLAGVGFGLILCGALALYAARGGAITLTSGLAMGAAGFISFSLAPSLGLPPELPGMAAAELMSRQLWWIGTSVATILGLIALVFGRAAVWRIVGVGLLLLPHLIGAPHISLEAGNVPAALAAEFVAASLVATAVFWVTLGSVGGWAFRRFA